MSHYSCRPLNQALSENFLAVMPGQKKESCTVIDPYLIITPRSQRKTTGPEIRYHVVLATEEYVNGRHPVHQQVLPVSSSFRLSCRYEGAALSLSPYLYYTRYIPTSIFMIR
jgi:hypothetical protein